MFIIKLLQVHSIDDHQRLPLFWRSHQKISPHTWLENKIKDIT